MSDDNLTLCLPRFSSKLDPKQPILVSSPKPEALPNDHVLLKVDRFGFSANNITYQVLGEHPHFRYFDFHAVPSVGEISAKIHGLVPVWGFATVIASSNPKIKAGERVYGYLAPCRYLLVPVNPADINKHAFYVPRPHLPADRRPYNQFLRCATDPQYIPTGEAEDFTMLYRPLFWTSYWCEDWLSLSSYRNASTIVISSASSKTAFCLAYLVGKRVSMEKLQIKIVGLTSNRNLAFTKKLKLYDEVIDYDSFTTDASVQTGNFLYVDVAGNSDLNQRIVNHFTSKKSAALVACVVLGYSSVSSPSSSEISSVDWTSPTRVDSSTKDQAPASESASRFENFFMVEWLQKRARGAQNVRLSIEEIFRRQNHAWTELMKDCTGWVRIERVYGGERVARAYSRIAQGSLGPETGYIWSLWDSEERAKL